MEITDPILFYINSMFWSRLPILWMDKHLSDFINYIVKVHAKAEKIVLKPHKN